MKQTTLNREVATVNLFFEPPEPDQSEEGGDDEENKRGAKHQSVATRVEEPGSEGEGNSVGDVPEYAQHSQYDHPLPGGGVLSNEAVGDQYECPSSQGLHMIRWIFFGVL